MPEQKATEEQFIAAWNKYGSPSVVAKELGLSLRRAYTLKQKYGLSTWNDTSGRRIILRHDEGRIDYNIENGKIIVFSDAHYWPNIRTTMHRALLTMVKQLKPDVIVCNGDAFDGGTISRYPRIGWDKKPSVIEELRAVDSALAEIESVKGHAELIWPLGNHDCLDRETECLTQRGWVKYDDIRQDDKVLSIQGNVCTWEPINEILKFDYDGDLFRIEKTRLSMAVTPNHRVLLDRLNWRDGSYTNREYRKADNLPSSFNIPMAAHMPNLGVDLSNDQISLAGWVITDGGIDKNGNVSIYQSKPDGRTEIERILDSLGYKYSCYVRDRDITHVCGRKLKKPCLPSAHYLIHIEDSRKVLEYVPSRARVPEWAANLTKEQFQVFLDAIVSADGVWDGNVEARTCCVIYKSKEFLDSLQAVAVCHGWRARVTIDNRGDPRLCLSKEPKIRCEKKEVFKEHYKGDIWCLRTPKENFMVRRNGAAYFTGNSRYETKLAACAPEFEGVHGFHLKDHFPRWRPCWTFWINDEVCVTHYYHSGIHAVHNNILKGQCHYVTGHTHSLKVTPWTNARGNTIWGVDTGSLADSLAQHNLDYQQGRHGNHRSGFAVLTFKDGDMLMPEIAMKYTEDSFVFRGHVIHADTGEIL